MTWSLGTTGPLKTRLALYCWVIQYCQKQFSGRRLYLGSRFSQRSSGPTAHGRVARHGACSEENYGIDGGWEAERKGQDNTVCKCPWCPDFFLWPRPFQRWWGFLACLLWQPLGGGWSFFTMSSGNSRDDEQQDGWLQSHTGSHLSPEWRVFLMMKPQTCLAWVEYQLGVRGQLQVKMI